LKKSNSNFLQLFIKVPFRDVNQLISSENISKTYKEEYFLRNEIEECNNVIQTKFDQNNKFHLDLRSSFKNAYVKNNLNNEIIIDHEVDYDIIDVEEKEDTEVICYNDNLEQKEQSEETFEKFLNNKDALEELMDHLINRYNSLTSCQKKCFQNIKSNLMKQNLIFITGNKINSNNHLLLISFFLHIHIRE
jgi:hypothetical protein